MPKTYPPELQQFIEHELESGKYQSEDELLVDALSLFREMKQRHDELGVLLNCQRPGALTNC